jgi:hypothetical protein
MKNKKKLIIQSLDRRRSWTEIGIKTGELPDCRVGLVDDTIQTCLKKAVDHFFF